MKANELMIGDWVQGFVPESNSTIYGIFNEQRIAIIAEPSKAYIELSIDDIRPIPLTPEILEKNGWEHKWWWVHPSTFICFQEGITGDFRVMPDTECDKRDWFATIKYVHELQHLYKLCEIEEEVVL